MRSRAVKLYLGKIVFSNAKVPRTSYKTVAYQTTTKAGRPVKRHRKVENGIERFKKSATQKQAQFGIHYQAGDVRTRSINANDIQLLNPNNVQARKDNPITTKAVRGYVKAIASAADGINKELKNRYSHSSPISSTNNQGHNKNNANITTAPDVHFNTQINHR